MPNNRLGAVAIGRNEGERLGECLDSLAHGVSHIVYVDSGSSDNSICVARERGVCVVALDTSADFTAARARNAGFHTLLQRAPDVEFVQFVDGDCEVAEGWLPAAQTAMGEDESLAVVCGRRRERFPEHSIYNRLCDMEWNTPVGPAKTCGGDALVRVTALRQVGGYNDQMIAGEEPELCVRLRQAGWKVRRIDAEMTRHDAAMTQAWQWWQRAVRAGHAYAEGTALHGRAPERHFSRETASTWWWAVAWPCLVLAGSLLWPWCLAGLLCYPLQVARIADNRRRRFHDARSHAWLYGLSCVLAKWPQLLGQLKYLRGLASGRRARLMEYKTNAG